MAIGMNSSADLNRKPRRNGESTNEVTVRLQPHFFLPASNLNIAPCPVRDNDPPVDSASPWYRARQNGVWSAIRALRGMLATARRIALRLQE